MWFRWICFVLAAACTVKALIGFLFHRRFYAWDRKQYASKNWPASFLIFIPYGILVLLFTWYATLFHYVPHGWIVTAIVTVSSIKLAAILFRWEKTSAAFVRFIDKGGWRLWLVDIVVLSAGLGFLLLGLFVY